MTVRITAAEFQEIMREAVPMVGDLGIRVLELGDGTAVMELPRSDRILRPGGTVTGPALMALADIVIYALIMTRLGRVELAVTTSLNINFLRRPEPADLIARGRLLKLGRHLAVGEVLIESPLVTDGPVAHATGTYALPPKRTIDNDPGTRPS